MRPSKILTLGGPQRYVDTFAVTPARLVPVVGTLAVSGGALQAATAGDWLKNLVANGEFTTNTTGWEGYLHTLSRVDSAVDPGAASGGADNWAAKGVRAAGAGGANFQIITAAPGFAYRSSVLVYSPSANVTVNAGSHALYRLPGYQVSAVTVAIEDVWQRLSRSVVALSGDTGVRFDVYVATENDVVYFDSASFYRQNTPALVAGWASPNFVATLDHISPASGVVPFSWLCRYTDSLNYWEIRVLPNTAGNDLSIVQVTAGVETTRAAADVDWTASGTDQLEVSALGATISTRYKKAGGAWAAGPSYTAATQGQGLPQMGPMYWGLSANRLAGWDLRGY